jgi:FdhD protein
MNSGTGIIKDYEVTLVHLFTKGVENRRDMVAIEEPLHIFVNGEHYASILSSPAEKEALVVGNMISEGLVSSLEDIREMREGRGGEFRVTLKDGIDVLKKLEISSSFKRLILSSCGASEAWPMSKLIDRINMPKVVDMTRFAANTISEGTKGLNVLASTFRKTGGVHAAAVYNAEGSLIAFAEDVGRHNAVDKVLGLALLHGQTLSGIFLALTGRLTGDIVLKAARLGIPLVVSLSAAIDSGVEVARKTGVTLIGFARSDRMTIYSFPERLVP